MRPSSVELGKKMYKCTDCGERAIEPATYSCRDCGGSLRNISKPRDL